MKLLLSKYYLLTKEVLPEKIEHKTIENLAIEDVPNIFMALPIKADSLTKEQIEVIKKAREQLVQEHDYQSDWMAHWQARFEAKHDALNTLLSGFGWVTVLQDQVVVRAQGDVWAWRVRTGEKPIAFKNHDGIEATLPNDIWLLTWAKESAQPNEGDLAADVALNYAEKLYEDQTDKSRFDLLKIERVIDTEVSTTIPTENHAVGGRVLAIAKRMIAAKHPFSRYEPLLKSLAAHKVVGKEAADLLEKHAPKPVVDNPPIENPILPIEKPNPEPTPISIYKRPFVITGLILSGSLAGFAAYSGYKAWGTKETPHRVEPKDTSNVKPVPVSPEPPIPVEITPKDTAQTKSNPVNPPPVVVPKPDPNPSPTLPPIPSVSLTNVNDLMKRAENNIEQCPTCISDAVNALNTAKKTGLDKTAYDTKVAEIGKLKQKVVGKLQTEANELSNTAENTGKAGKVPQAVRVLETARKKLELENKINASKEVQERLIKVNERIQYWESVY
jgi:hypothetical protein